ncbi:GIY-YIG nuclease family protein [Bauldia litoralis]|uniref:GIY-YIG nuclease family protein n=1 Tax=Bauldia litoralis TaxID=665467 RepID=UPI003265ABCA
MIISRVYFVRCGNGIKIGTSTDVTARMDALANANPHPLILIGVIDGGVTVERLIHDALSEYRIHREWFHARKPVIDLIDRLIARGPEILPGFRSRERLKVADLSAQQVVAKTARDIWPHKTAEALARITGYSTRSAENWLAGHRVMSGGALISLIQSDVGQVFIDAIRKAATTIRAA